jgi:hypothetical protein
MAITVVIARDDVGAPTTREVYEIGVKFSTEGGDLSIISAKPQLLALYGSGNWLSVHVDDHVQVITERPAEDSDSDSDFSFGDDDDSSSDSSDTDFDFGSDSSDDDSDSTESDDSTDTDSDSDSESSDSSDEDALAALLAED